ncbi:MAG: putative benzaldehyde dehydrogenase [Microbacteriaceae bacterium]|jgi:coniferyl-aldehyde dehydrogenase|nr:putative benzaldehyde dehydrogenase [Microbacteriaceae bacterium]
MNLTRDVQTESLWLDPTSDELRAALDRQIAAFRLEGPPSAETRRDRIARFALAVLEHADELTAALAADFGSRPEHFSLLAELSVDGFTDHVLDSLDSWMTDELVPEGAAMGLPTFIESHPKGVVGIIGPWNFPVGLVVQPAVEALAAGNRLMIKFSEIPERTAEVFARAVASRMTPEEVLVVRGGPQTAAAFSALPFDHIFFTGSPAVGRRVAAAAGANLVPVTLELGGKNPVVVHTSADLTQAAQRIAGNRMINGGQLCLCPDYVFVPADRVDGFVDAYLALMAQTYPDYFSSSDVVSSINPANFKRVTALIDDARSKGATVLRAVDQGGDDLAQSTRRIPPTLLLGVTDEMAIASEEIFGPVIVVYPYDDLDAALEYIDSRPLPLVAYFYGEDNSDFHQFLKRTRSGGVTRNDMALHLSVHDVPFGGVGQSGSGSYHGKAGFDTFSHQRAVTASAWPFSASSFVTPPYPAEALLTSKAKVRASIEKYTDRVNG